MASAPLNVSFSARSLREFVIKRFAPSAALLGLVLFFVPATRAEQHRATRLGNPATRFADPIVTVDDLRSRFRDERLKADMTEVLRQWGWKGRVDDLQHAALTGEVRAVSIAVGAVMPFMSSRENGKPICLRNVTWAGQEPAPAFLFNFNSNGRNYRCVTPKACSNFYVEDLGATPVPALALECTVQGQVFPGHPFDFCLIVRNPGTGPAPRTTVRLQLPPNVIVAQAREGNASTDEVNWELPGLDPKETKKLCVRLTADRVGPLQFAATATASGISGAGTACSTKVIGVPAVLIDMVDLEDPVEIGSEETYEVKITNQGSADLNNVKLAFTLPPNEEFISGGGPSEVSKTGSSIVTAPLAVLHPKDRVVWHIVVKALQPGDVRVQVDLSSDEFQKPIREEESTRLY